MHAPAPDAATDTDGRRTFARGDLLLVAFGIALVLLAMGASWFGVRWAENRRLVQDADARGRPWG